MTEQQFAHLMEVLWSINEKMTEIQTALDKPKMFVTNSEGITQV